MTRTLAPCTLFRFRSISARFACSTDRVQRGLVFCERKKLPDVRAGGVRSGFDLTFHPQMIVVADFLQVRLVCVFLANGVDDQATGQPQIVQRFNDGLSCRHGVNHGVQFYRRALSDVPGPDGVKVAGEVVGSGIAGTLEHVGAWKQILRELQHEMRRAAKIRQSKASPVRNSAQPQRPIPDRSGTRQRSGFGVA